MYYQQIFTLANHYNYSISELENMYPFERDIYYGLLTNYVEKTRRQDGN